MKFSCWLSILFILAFFLACEKDNLPPVQNGDMGQCHFEKSWDTASIKAHLLGHWDWFVYVCASYPENNFSYDKLSGLSVQFNADNTIHIYQDGQLEDTLTWSIVNRHTNIFSLDTEPYYNPLKGWIFVCDDWMELSNSQRDGCDNHFKRQE